MIGDSVSLGEDGGYYTVRVDAYWPSRFGLFNVIGNVAEMTDVEGVQKGGCWLVGRFKRLYNRQNPILHNARPESRFQSYS